jgi:hypothetical protein
MESGGVDRAKQTRRQDEALIAEEWFAAKFGGVMATEYEDATEHWDVRVGEQRYDVKSHVPHHRFVNGGQHRPRYPAPVVEVGTRDTCRLLGIVPTAPGFEVCWFVTIEMVDPRTRPSTPIGTPLGDARQCPACGDWHPAGTTCAGGWASWMIELPWEVDP